MPSWLKACEVSMSYTAIWGCSLYFAKYHAMFGLGFFGYCRSVSLMCSDFLVDVIVTLENKHYVTSAWGFCKR